MDLDLDSGLEMSNSPEVMAARELENSWCILDQEDELGEIADEALEERCTRSTSSSSSDIEVIQEACIENESPAPSYKAIDTLLSPSPSYANLETSELLLNPEEEIDLNPGIKVYRKPYTPNAKVNYLLNISLLVAVAAVTGLGIGNYITNRGLVKVKEQFLKQQLETCLMLNQTSITNTQFASTLGPYRSDSIFDEMDAKDTSTTKSNITTTLSTVSPSSVAVIATAKAISTVSTATPFHHKPSEQVKSIKMIVPIEPAPDHIMEGNFVHVTVPLATVSPNNIIMNDASFRHCQALDQNLIVETTTSFDLTTSKFDKHSRKRKHPSYKSSNGQNSGPSPSTNSNVDVSSLTKKLNVWLLITDKGTSRPVFFTDHPRKEELNIISRQFISSNFEKGRTTLWLDGCPECLSLSPKSFPSQCQVVPSEDNYWLNKQAKLAKNFWSKVKRSVYAGGQVENEKMLKEKIFDSILSLTEVEYQEMFAKLRSKVRKAQAKDSLCGESV